LSLIVRATEQPLTHRLGLSDFDQEALLRAHNCLEHPSLAARLSNLVGTPIEMATKLMPSRWSKKVNRCSEMALETALDVALRGMKDGKRSSMAPALAKYKILGGLSGAIGGFWGGPAMLLEMPFMTILMMRRIAQIASRHGEALDSMEARMACLEVFALGGPSHQDDASETGYYGMRLSLEVPIARAAAYLRQPQAKSNIPLIVKLMTQVTERFGVVLSQKAMAMTVPILGAGGAAFINVAFMNHFEDMAESHFTIRQLERKYGQEQIKEAYNAMKISTLNEGPFNLSAMLRNSTLFT